jgi:positive regulator of sigma E activity
MIPPASESHCAETGRVVSIRDGLAVIEIAPTESCARCGICSGTPEQRMRVEARAAEGLDEGRLVRVTFPYRSKWRSILFVFVLPITLFLGMGLAANAAVERLKLPAAAGALCAIGGLTAGLFIARVDDIRFRRQIRERTLVEPLDEP